MPTTEILLLIVGISLYFIIIACLSQHAYVIFA
jgi:hypothetical protein